MIRLWNCCISNEHMKLFVTNSDWFKWMVTIDFDQSAGSCHEVKGHLVIQPSCQLSSTFLKLKQKFYIIKEHWQSNVCAQNISLKILLILYLCLQVSVHKNKVKYMWGKNFREILILLTQFPGLPPCILQNRLHIWGIKTFKSKVSNKM